MDKGVDIKDALKTVVEQKLIGTYRIAIMEVKNPERMIFVKNSGDFVLGLSKNNDELLVSSDSSVFNNLGWSH
jgi:glucosamine 6-phosphate synthetase-like amidotransferase/phosphosugar isomerase protein